MLPLTLKMKSSLSTPVMTKIEAKLLRLHLSAKKALERSEMLRKDATQKVVLYENAAKALLREAREIKKQGSRPTKGQTGLSKPETVLPTAQAEQKTAALKRPRKAVGQVGAMPAAPAGLGGRIKATKKVSGLARQPTAKLTLEGLQVNADTPSVIELPSLKETLVL